MSKAIFFCVAGAIAVILVLFGAYYSIAPAKIVSPTDDVKPSFLHDATNFTRNFNDLFYRDYPQENYLNYKTSTNVTIENNSVSLEIVPSFGFQAVYVFVADGGKATVTMQVCNNGKKIIEGGVVVGGWNLLALDLEDLVKAAGCPPMALDMDSPVVTFTGSAELSVWRSLQATFFAVEPSPTQIMIVSSAYLLIVFLLVNAYIFYLIDNQNQAPQQELY